MRPYKGNDGVTRDSIAWVAQTKAGQIGEVTPGAPSVPTAGYMEVDESEPLPF
jgi:hypothetical protein